MGNNKSSNKIDDQIHHYTKSDIIEWKVLEIYFPLNLKYELDLRMSKNVALTYGIIPFHPKDDPPVKLISNSMMNRMGIINDYWFNVENSTYPVPDYKLSKIKSRLMKMVEEVNDEFHGNDFLTYSLKLFNSGKFVTIPINFIVSNNKYASKCDMSSNDFCIQGFFAVPVFNKKEGEKTTECDYDKIVKKSISMIISKIFNDIIVSEKKNVSTFVSISHKKTLENRYISLPVEETVILKQNARDISVYEITDQVELDNLKAEYSVYINNIMKVFE